MTNKWIVEVARLRCLANECVIWEPAGKDAASSMWHERDRKIADGVAAQLAAQLGDSVLVRCRGTDPRRGAFYPRPRPART